MAYAAGCICEDCRFGHRMHWLSLSEPQAELVAVLATRTLSVQAVRLRGFRVPTIAALQRNRPLVRRFAVIGSGEYLALTRRGREVWTYHDQPIG